MITYSTELAAASQYNISSKTLIVDLPFINSVPSHISNLGIGGLKTFPNSCYLANDDADIAEVRLGQGTILLNPLKNLTGSITYLQSTNKYYMWSSSAWQLLAALTTGIPNFSSGLTASGIYVTSLGNIFLDGGNIATTGTASFSQITTSYASLGTVTSGTWNGSTIAVNKGGTGQTSYNNGQLLIGNATGNTLTKATLTQGTGVSITNGAGSITIAIGQSVATTVSPTFAGITLSNLTPNTLPIASTNGRLINSQITDNGSLITLGRATYVNGNFQANGTASATQITASTGFYSPGTSNLTTLNVSTISSSGLATLTDLYVPGNTQLGNAATDTTSVFGTLSIVNAGSTSGSITCDSSGNLIFDGSGAGGVEITDGLMYLGSIPIQSGSYGGTSYTGGMISSSMKVVALHGFSNRTNDDDASFEVDTAGNLLCYSLKETSLRAYKHEIQYITKSQLLNISKLQPLTFLYNIDNPEDVNDPQLRQAGFIALLVLLIYPEVAWYKEGKLAGLQYQRLTAYLTKGIQLLIEKNKKLLKRLNKKDKDVTKLNSRVTLLEDLVEDLLRRFSLQ